MKKITIVLPAYNEGEVISKVIRSVRKEGWKDIVVVNDCSKDGTGSAAKKAGAKVVFHFINRGAGATTKTGIDYALENGADIIVTMDSDGQHLASDIKKVVQPILDGRADVVIGSRLLDPKGMPLVRRIANTIGNIMTYFLFGIWTTDSQSGFKAFSRKAAQRIQIKTNRYEFCSEVISEIKRKKLRFVEVPITVIYTDYSLGKAHGQGFVNGFKTLAKLVLRKLID